MAGEVESFLDRIVEPIEYLASTTFVFRIRIEFIAYHFFGNSFFPMRTIKKVDKVNSSLRLAPEIGSFVLAIPLILRTCHLTILNLQELLF